MNTPIFNILCDEYGAEYVRRVLGEVKYTHGGDWDSAMDAADDYALYDDAPQSILDALNRSDEKTHVLHFV